MISTTTQPGIAIRISDVGCKSGRDAKKDELRSFGCAPNDDCRIDGGAHRVQSQSDFWMTGWCPDIVIALLSQLLCSD